MLTDGLYTAQAEQSDSIGNIGVSSANTFTIDTVAPTSGITFPVAGPYNAAGWNGGCAAAGLCGTAADTSGTGIQKVEISLLKVGDKYWSGSVFDSTSEVFIPVTGTTGWSYGFGFGQFGDGSYTVHVRATDNVGNTETAGTTRTFVIDGTAPETTINSGPADGSVTNSTTAGFTYASNETDSTFECQLDSTGFVSCEATGKTYNNLTEGSHTFQVRAIDKANNTDASPAGVTWRVDTTAPVLTVPSNFSVEATGPSGATVDYTVSALDAVDGLRPVNCSPVSGSTFAIGQTTVNCSSSDLVGNTAIGSFTVTVQDMTAPVLTLPLDITAEATSSSGGGQLYGYGSGYGRWFLNPDL